MKTKSFDSESGVAIPMWISTAGGQVFSWYHPPSSDVSRQCAVLLCDPFGADRMHYHLTYRALACHLAGHGFPVMRMDFPGTCDSEGYPRDSARIEIWLSSLATAADHLKAWSGAREIAIFGALLGGTLSLLFASRRHDVSTALLWAPYIQGRSAIRAGLAATVTSDSNPEGHRPSSYVEGDQESLGFLLTRAMVDDLQAIDLLKINFDALKQVFILRRSDTSPEPKLAQYLSDFGIDVEVREKTSDEIDNIPLTEGTSVPVNAIQNLTDWLIRKYPGLDGRKYVSSASFGPSEVIYREKNGQLIKESIVRFGTDDEIFAILSEPNEVLPGRPAILIASGGHNHRSGINRNHTEWARALASMGYQVLRMDRRGLGDSASDINVYGHLYEKDAHQDVATAISWLKNSGASSIACVGLCAGSYQSFHAALKGSPIDSLIMLNPILFHKENIELIGMDIYSGERWRNVVKNVVDGGSLSRERLKELYRLLRMIIRSSLPVSSNLILARYRISRSFLKLINRKIRIHIVFNDNELASDFLRYSLRPIQKTLDRSGLLNIENIGHSDHIYSPLWSQEKVQSILIRFFKKYAKNQG